MARAATGMLSASALRSGTAADDALRDDYDACFQRVRDELYARIETQARRRKYDFVVMDYTSVLCDVERMPRTHVKPSTFFTGFWDKERRAHDGSSFARIGRDPLLLALRSVFTPLGYTLEDVSDPERSKRSVLKVRIG